MADIVDKATRSRMMSGIRGRDTQPEWLIRRALHRLGFRYRLHARELPGRPDLVFPRYRKVIFVHGCFWHAHDCHLFRLPATNRQFWQEKILGNRQRDEQTLARLKEQGWLALTIWECALRGPTRQKPERLINSIVHWLEKGKRVAFLKGLTGRG